MNIELLLQKAKSISQKYDEIYKNTGNCFNIFTVADIGTDERRICRILKEIIDPKGNHYQGCVYLELFIRDVLGISEYFSNEELANAVVEREKLIADNRRIDLYIRIADRVAIPIEVKINARDQEAQCYAYHKYAYDHDGNPKLYYLTLYGDEPSEYSLRELNRDLIRCISFKDEIVTWLRNCLRCTETIRTAPIREIIMQFIDCLKGMTNQAGDKMKNELLELILSSEESFKSAQNIEESVKNAGDRIATKCYKEIDQKIVKKYHVERTPYPGDMNDIAGLLYKIEEVDKEQWLSLCIEIMEKEHVMVVGLCITEIQKGFTAWGDEALMPKQCEVIDGTYNSREGYWIAYEYLTNKDGETPNFKRYDENFVSLLNGGGFNAFINSAMCTIDGFINALKEPYRSRFNI